MRKSMTAMAAVFVFTACDGNPFVSETTTEATTETETTTTTTNETTGETTTTDTTTGVTGGALPPGTPSPTPSAAIVRFEATDAIGGGLAQSFAYDAATDTFSVDNLPFDGNSIYTRDNQVGNLGPFAVYENSSSITDPTNSAAIPQFEHKALYGVSTSGNTEFALVRTGAYVDYGFGGFVYQRNNDVTIPTSGQAIFTGNYAALRDYQGKADLDYVTGDMQMFIDFDDFNSGAGVRGEVRNRSIFDTAGNDITSSVLAEYGTTLNANLTQMPVLFFNVSEGVADANGEIIGTVGSTIIDSVGAVVPLETGNYYAVLSGTNATEVVGVIVTTSGQTTTVTARDTGGFILYR